MTDYQKLEIVYNNEDYWGYVHSDNNRYGYNYGCRWLDSVPELKNKNTTPLQFCIDTVKKISLQEAVEFYPKIIAKIHAYNNHNSSKKILESLLSVHDINFNHTRFKKFCDYNPSCFIYIVTQTNYTPTMSELLEL